MGKTEEPRPEDALSCHSRRVLMERAKSVDIDRGQEIFRGGDIGKGLYYLESGLVVVGRSSPTKHKADCRFVFSGKIFGYDHYLIGKRHRTTAIALDKCTVRIFHHGLLSKIAKSDPMFGRYLGRIVRLDRVDQEKRLAEEQRLVVRYRLARFIGIYLTRRPVPLADGAVKFRLPIKSWQIADYLGVSAETLSRAVRALQDEEFMYFSKQWVDIQSLEDFHRRIHAIETAFGI